MLLGRSLYQILVFIRSNSFSFMSASVKYIATLNIAFNSDLVQQNTIILFNKRFQTYLPFLKNKMCNYI